MLLLKVLPIHPLSLSPDPGIIIVGGTNIGQTGPQGERGYTGEEGPIGPQGVEGPLGPIGPIGPQGPEGSPGTAVGSANYQWKTDTAVGDPGHGFIKGNNVDAELITELYASVYSSEGRVIRFDQIEVGGIFMMYESGQLETWNRYEVTAPVVVHNNEWFTVPCVFVETAALPFTPGNNARIEVQTPVKGDPGPRGETGPIGPQGPQGVQGVKGDTGSQGVTGDTGNTGPQGIQGVKGDTGSQGPIGLTGADSTVPGPQGPQGLKGDKGDQGNTGPASTVPGPQGIQGPQGVKGDAGAASTVPGPGVAAGGAVGEVLTKKSTTAYDTEWKPAAPATDLVYHGDYVPATPYKDGDIVVYNGTPWMAVKQTTTPPDPFPLPPGGAELAYEGDYAAATEYADGDVVVKDGVAYMCVGGPTTEPPDPEPWGAAVLAPPAGTPAGAGMMWFSDTPPDGWALLDGSTLINAQTTYPELWANVDPAWKSGANIVLPDTRGRMPVGKGTGGDTNALGKSDGLAVGDRTPRHRHTVIDPTHGHSVYDPGHTHYGARAAQAYGDSYTGMMETWGAAIANVDGAGTGISIYGAATGIRVGVDATPPLDAPAHVVVNYIIKL